MTESDVSRRRRWTVAAIAVFVIGLVILIPSGLCTAIVGVPMVASMIQQPGDASTGLAYLLMDLAIGGPFIIVGLVLLRVAFAMRSRK